MAKKFCSLISHQTWYFSVGIVSESFESQRRLARKSARGPGGRAATQAWTILRKWTDKRVHSGEFASACARIAGTCSGSPLIADQSFISAKSRLPIPISRSIRDYQFCIAQGTKPVLPKTRRRTIATNLQSITYAFGD